MNPRGDGVEVAHVDAEFLRDEIRRASVRTMFSLIKAVMAFALLCALVFTLFLFDVGGQSLASHIDDIWSSAVVQDKIATIRDDVRVQLEDELKRNKADETGEISEKDRAELESLLRAKAD